MSDVPSDASQSPRHKSNGIDDVTVANAATLDIGLHEDGHVFELPARLFEQLPFAIYICDRDGLVLRYNRRAAELWGRSPKLGDPNERFCGSFRMYRPDGRLLPHHECPMADVLRTGMSVRQQEVHIERPDGSRGIALVDIEAVKDSDGNIVGAVNCFQDITERKRADERQKVLMAELDHRVKNVLARVDVVAMSTRHSSNSVDEFVRSLRGRIQSMAVAHSLLSQSGWRGVGLTSLVHTQLAPYATDVNIRISGTDLTLTAAETQAVAMVLHELVTNAAKYGALSVPEGEVSISWDRKLNGDATAILMLEWRELSGPPMATEVQSGYGTSLIRELVPHELGGKVDLVFESGGVICRIEIQLGREEHEIGDRSRVSPAQKRFPLEGAGR